MRKFMLALVAALAVGVVVLTPTNAEAQRIRVGFGGYAPAYRYSGYNYGGYNYGYRNYSSPYRSYSYGVPYSYSYPSYGYDYSPSYYGGYSGYNYVQPYGYGGYGGYGYSSPGFSLYIR